MKVKKSGRILVSTLKNIKKGEKKSPILKKKKTVSFKIFFIGSLISAGILLIFGMVTVYILSRNLASLQKLERSDPAVATRIYSADGKVIHELFMMKRLYIPISKIPDYVVKALLAAEDREFYHHWGVNIKGIPRAMLVNLQAMSFKQGFSTITMQLSRNLYESIGFEKSIKRKILEMLTAIELEKNYSKEEILEMYLNVAYFGHGVYGVEAASKKYFNKKAENLAVDEGAMLVGLLPSPKNYSPFRNMDRAMKRKAIVLKSMVEWAGFSQKAYDTLKTKPLNVFEGEEEEEISPYFTEYVRIQLNKLQDSLDINVYEEGLHVFTTLDTRLQAVMDSSVRKWYPVIQQEVRDDPAKKEMKEELEDSLFNEKTVLQLGFIAIEPGTGHIQAMVGGADFSKYKFNHVTQPRRQPGSVFKPILYTAAIDNGYLPTDTYLNQPIVVENADGTRWTPENYDHSVGGPTPLREGLRRSLNLISIHLINDITPRVVVDYARRLGIRSPLSPYAPLALGASGIKPVEAVTAFSVFANHGILIKPISITKIEDRYGNVIYENKPVRKEVLSPTTSFIMTKLLQNVIDHGTGGGARWKYGFYKTAAGKTGTTNDYSDAWFMGFSPHLVTGIWIGLEDFRIKLGPRQTGAHTALPFWATFMKMAYDTLQYEDVDFIKPNNIIEKDVCKESFKLANPSCPETYTEYFKEGEVPFKHCDVHGKNHRRRKISF